MNPTYETLREFAGIFILLGAVVWGLWTARRRLRPWFVVFWGALAAISIPTALYVWNEAQAGAYTGWGGMVVIVVLLPAAFVAALSLTALLTLAVLIPKYGFNEQTPEEREAERQYRRSPEYLRKKNIRDLKITGAMLAVVLLIVAFRRLFLP